MDDAQEVRAEFEDLSTVEEEPEDIDLSEPLDAVRLSPYAVAGFVVSLLGFYLSDRAIFAFFEPIAWERLPLGLIPVAAAIVALWLTAKAAEEIYVSDGALGGVGYVRGARAVAIVTLALAAASVVLSVLTANPDWINFDL